jgi:uncharacterized protein
MRVVIDTNVFISSFFGGNPRQIITLWTEGHITLCLSRHIIEEYVEVLERLELKDRAALEGILAFFANGINCLYAATPPELNVIEADPDDDHFLACAVALNAKTIVSGDQHLLDIENYMEIKIITPKQFLDALDNTT